jgi:2'-5' RNA ligase
MKQMGKYYLALLPPDPIEQEIRAIKELLKTKFNVKYALNSPSHVTLKMPFSYQESKEEFLVKQLTSFLHTYTPFSLKISGLGHFGKRVIFHPILLSEPLSALQAALGAYCKKSLHLPLELSDQNFQAHLTLAYKDLKKDTFLEVLALANAYPVEAEFDVEQLSLMKRTKGRWNIQAHLPLGNPPS